MKNIVLALALLIPCVSTVSAEVVFQQVYYDPIGTESGGEAIELFNRGTEAVDLSGWTIATESSAKDVIFPDGTVIAPMKPLLVADEGWSEKKDGAAWRKADIIQTMTLGNENSWVALKRPDNQTEDVLGWGEESEFFKGKPAGEIVEGDALARVSNTGDNSKDFITARVDFSEGILVPITADISIRLPVIEVSESLALKPEGMLIIKNNGESDIRVEVRPNDLQGKAGKIPKEALEVVDGLAFTVKAGQEYRTTVKVRQFDGLVAGKYQGSLRIVIN